MRSESVGRIKLVGLDGVRTALGDRWPAMAAAGDGDGRVGDQAALRAAGQFLARRRYQFPDVFRRVERGGVVVSCRDDRPRDPQSADRPRRRSRQRLRAFGRGGGAVIPTSANRMRRFQATLLNGLDKQMQRLEQESRQTLTDRIGQLRVRIWCRCLGVMRRRSVARQVLIPLKLQHQLVMRVGSLAQGGLRGLRSGWAADGARGAARGYRAGEGQCDTVAGRNQLRYLCHTGAATERFFATCAKIDPRVSSCLIVLLTSLPQGLPRSRLLDCINRLRPFCRSVGYLVDDVAEVSRIRPVQQFQSDRGVVRRGVHWQHSRKPQGAVPLATEPPSQDPHSWD